MGSDTTKTSSTGGVKTFAFEVGRAATVDLVAKGLTALLLLLVAGLGLLIWQGGSVPAWAAVLVVVALLAVVAVGAVRGARERQRLAGAVATRDVRIGALKEELERLEEKVSDYDDLALATDKFGWAIDRFELYTDHVADVLDRLQRVLSGELDGVTIPDYIERGIIAPARDVLRGAEEDIRISVLLAHDDRWRMVWCAGHSLDGQNQYNERIVDTLSRMPYETGQPSYWPDVQQDDRFSANAYARRPFCSMLSHPVRSGSTVVGVLNVVSSAEDAFDPAEQRYIASLSSVIGVAVGVYLDRQRRAAD